MSSNDPVCLVRFIVFIALVILSVGTSAAQPAPPAKYPDYPSETPAEFKPVTKTFEYEKRDVMVPMGYGVKLHTVIIVPKGAKGAPILLTRTPYDASAMTSHGESSHLAPIFESYDNPTDLIVEGEYIREFKTRAASTVPRAIT